MQNKEVMNRLNNPPVTDGRKKPIDLNDMPEDMDIELIKAAVYGMVEAVLISYKDQDISKKAVRHNIGKQIFRLFINEQFGLRLGNILKKVEDRYRDDDDERRGTGRRKND
tara:strand:- start:846 stop:1178 length:333 start_codon:yes stop_codon:yes gene_type:complete